MSDEHDSWFKSAFGVDLGAAVDKITTVVDQVKKKATHVVESVQAGVVGAVGAGASSFPLGSSVGKGGKNALNDVRAVQAALGIAADGQCGPQTIAAIKAFQKTLGQAKPDGRVDPGGGTERALAGSTKPVVTPEPVSEPSSIPTASTDHEDNEDLVGALLGQQAALLKSLQNAGSDAEREQIQEELDGVDDEISSELQTLQAKEAVREDESPETTSGAEELGQASGMGFAQDGNLIAVGEHWLTGQIDTLQDTAAAKVQDLADRADGIPGVEQAADFGAGAFDQATQLSAGAMEGAVGMGGALLQTAAHPIDTAKGLYTMAEHVPMPIAGPNPLKAAHAIADVVTGEATFADTTDKLFDPAAQQKEDAAYWKTVGGAIAGEYEKTVGADGDYAKGAGRLIFDVASNLIGVGEAGAAAKAAEAAKLAEAARLASLAKAAEAADVAKLAELAKSAKLAEVPALAERSKLLEAMLEDSSKVFEARRLLETMLDDAAKAIKSSEVVEGIKTAVGKGGAPKAGGVTAENINRVTGMQAVLGRMDKASLRLNDLGLTPDDVIRAANKDPAAAIAELNRRLDIAEVRAGEVEAHAISRQAKLDAWHAEAEAERRWFREEAVGRTPGKESPTGRSVIDRMRGEGKIRGTPPNEEVFHPPTQEWYPLAECDMGHTTDAVRWWNKEGMYYGDKAEAVRNWMNDPKNYELEPSGINRSRGAQVDEHYVSPHDDPITPDELAGKVKDRPPPSDE